MTKVRGAFKFTDKLKQWLDLKGWTQKEFAEILGVDVSHISQIISGHRHPSWQMLRKLCHFTRLNVGDLLYFDFDAEQEEN